jgi:SAM-dependent methyltransferase
MPDRIQRDAPAPETDRLRERYARRQTSSVASRYDPLSPSVYLPMQEKERALIRWIMEYGIDPVAERRVLDVGCGTGEDLLQLIRLGFDPAKLVGCELLPERAEEARRRLPGSVQIVVGDAVTASLDEAAFDVVMHTTVFTSILDDEFQAALAERMWSLVRPGGGVLWCDFVYDNPRNPDVRGIPVRRVRTLFPHGSFRSRRIGLAPPLSRSLTRIHPALYGVANTIPWLRAYVLCWIAKSAGAGPPERNHQSR